jgi:hypothetical protein
MAWGKSKGGGGGCLAVLALLVALAALFVAGSAYRRTGGTLGELTQGMKGLDRSFPVGDADWKRALDKARERLQERRPEVADQRNLEQVRRDVAEIRETLERSFRGTGSEAKDKWHGLDGDLQHLEAQLREGGAKARTTLDEVLEKMKR